MPFAGAAAHAAVPSENCLLPRSSRRYRPPYAAAGEDTAALGRASRGFAVAARPAFEGERIALATRGACGQRLGTGSRRAFKRDLAEISARVGGSGNLPLPLGWSVCRIPS